MSDRAPDLQIGGLSVWINRREFPEADYYWDANWLSIDATVKSSDASVRVSGPYLRTDELQRFGQAIRQMHRDLTGSAILSGLEPNLRIELQMGNLGHIDGLIEIVPDPSSIEFHRFEVDGISDQTYLTSIADQIDAILERYPVVRNDQ